MAGLVLALGTVVAYILATWTTRLAARGGGFADRRMLVLCAMLQPGLVLRVLLGGSVAMVLAGCPFFTPLDHWLVAVIAGGFLALVAVACMRQTLQSVRIRRELTAISEPVLDGPLHARLGRLASEVGVRRPELRLAPSAEPLACSLGIFNPTVVLSSGLVAMLDDQECEAVLAHELAHLKQKDHLVGFLVAWLRDGLFYMPTAREAWDRYRHDREIDCDALSATATGRPAALASALFKVSAGHVGDPCQVAHFGPESSQLETRLAHLLGDKAPATARRAIVSYGLLAAGVMLTIMALTPVWYLPVCMTLFCRTGG